MLDRAIRPHRLLLARIKHVMAWIVMAVALWPWSPAKAEFDAHGGPIKGIAVSKDGAQALTASFDYSILLWDLADQSVEIELHGHDAAVNAVAFIGEEGRALSASDDGTAAVWDLITGKPIARLEGHEGKVAAIAVSPDRRLAASAGWDRTVRLWDLGTMEPVRTLHGADNLNAVAFSPDGKRVLSGSSNGSLQAWRVVDGAQAMALSSHDFAVTGLDQSPDGRTVATSSVDETVQLWDIATGQGLVTLYGHKGPVLAVALSDDGQLVASGGVDGTVRVWRRGDGDRLKIYARHQGPVWSVTFAPDSDTLLSGGADGLMMTYNLEHDETASAPIALADASTTSIPKKQSRGERLFKTCIACHTIRLDDGHKAGPTLYKLFGRKAGSHPGYRYSKALEDSHLVWTEETIDQLFDLGPEHLLPGTKMPLQRMPDPKDRADLIAFLKQVTTP